MKDGPLDALIKALGGLPGLGPRSARRVALHLLTNKEKRMNPLMSALSVAAENVKTCQTCGNLDLTDPCRICADPLRAGNSLCIVAGVGDLWAVERTGAYKGQYHVLGGVLSALDGIGPAQLSIGALLDRVQTHPPSEIIFALAATVDGQSTAHYLSDRLSSVTDVPITSLARGMPMGGELDYLDDGTIATAFKARKSAA